MKIFANDPELNLLKRERERNKISFLVKTRVTATYEITFSPGVDMKIARSSLNVFELKYSFRWVHPNDNAVNRCI